MLKLTQPTIVLLANSGHKIASWHLAYNHFLLSGGYVTARALSNLTIAKIEARMNSIGIKKPKLKIKKDFSLIENDLKNLTTRKVNRNFILLTNKIEKNI